MNIKNRGRKRNAVKDISYLCFFHSFLHNKLKEWKLKDALRYVRRKEQGKIRYFLESQVKTCYSAYGWYSWMKPYPE